MAASQKQFVRKVLLDLKSTKYYWVGVESWSISDGDEDKETKPALVKREIVYSKSGDHKIGKCKGFTADDLELVVSNTEKIMKLLLG